MRYFLGFFFPWLTFFTLGKPFQGIFCLFLQLTVIGWLPAVIWCYIVINSYEDRKAIEKRLDNFYQR